MKKYIWLASVLFLVSLGADDGGYRNIVAGTDNFGKYAFTPAQGANLCKNTIIGNLGCCEGTYTLRSGLLTNGLEWRLGANAMRCQEAMCTLFLGDRECRYRSCLRVRGLKNNLANRPVCDANRPDTFDECTAFRRDCH